jgi:two-component system chemotaxis sensor kinase CheA
MTPLLEQFLSEARDVLQGIGENLMQLEDAPGDADLMVALFRMVHTLKGNSGLFDFPEMTRVLHAGEDLMDAVRHGRAPFSKGLADRLLDAMDFVGMLCDEIEAEGGIGAQHAANSARLAESLRELSASVEAAAVTQAAATLDSIAALPSTPANAIARIGKPEPLPLIDVPEAVRMHAFRLSSRGAVLHWLDYAPAEECFFQGDDPFFQVRGTPDLLWGRIGARQPWPALATLDAYRCMLNYQLLTAAPGEELDEYYRYVPDQVRRVAVQPLLLALPAGDTDGDPEDEDFIITAVGLLEAGHQEELGRAVRARLELVKAGSWRASALRWLRLVMELEPENRAACVALLESLRDLSPPAWSELGLSSSSECSTPENEALPAATTLTSEEAEVLTAMLDVQREILLLPIAEAWQLGRLEGVAAVLASCLRARGDIEALAGLQAATAQARKEAAATALLLWFDAQFPATRPALTPEARSARVDALVAPELDRHAEAAPGASDAEPEQRFGRRSEDAYAGPKSLKVDQGKIDRLMNLIGEMVVSKNALPYLAARAENVFGARDLARELMSQYAVINRIAEEMRGVIMEVCMMPVSFVLQRFPRLVRDTAQRLGKEVNLVLLGEDTEADKNIITSLADPLVHIVRNSLDHGFESPEVRCAAGKPAAGTLTIIASQEADRVVIEVRDDGKGIDTAAIKLKAYQKGLIAEAALDQLSEQEAVNLVFVSGLSTADVVSDLSGRGVGMDVVKTAVERVSGTVSLQSEKGKGTRIRLSLPLSMAVTNVMIVESDSQTFGVPMGSVAETVRVPQSAVRTIKKSLAIVLRGRVVPLKAINSLLGLGAPPRTNAEDELAVLVLRLGDELVGLLVDDFREAADIILKPLTGVLAGLSTYCGSALMGDGSVLMVLDPQEILR